MSITLGDEVTVFFTGWNKSNSFTHLTLESNKALARSYLSPCGHRVDSKLRHLAARHLSDTLSNNWSSLIDLAVEDYVLNCLEKGGSSVGMNAVDIWITVWKLCLKMMAADLRKPALDLSGCVLLKFIFTKPSRLSFIANGPVFHHVLSSQVSPPLSCGSKQVNLSLQRR